MAHIDNPAGRLQGLLESAKGEQQNASAVEGWCRIFSLTTPDDDFFLLGKFGQMVSLAHQTRDLVERLEDDDPDLVLQHFDEVERTLTRCLQVAGQTMEWHLSGLGTTGMHSLALCSSLLHRRMPEETIDVGARARLTERVMELMEEVRTADDLDQATKDMLLDKLADILEAILDIDMRGAAPVRNAAEAMIGSLRTQRGLWERAARSKVAAGLYGFLVLVDLALNLTVNARSLEAPESPVPSLQIVEIWIDSTGQQPPALPPGSTEVEVIDGEVVDDHDVIDDSGPE